MIHSDRKMHLDKNKFFMKTLDDLSFNRTIESTSI